MLKEFTTHIRGEIGVSVDWAHLAREKHKQWAVYDTKLLDSIKGGEFPGHINNRYIPKDSASRSYLVPFTTVHPSSLPLEWEMKLYAFPLHTTVECVACASGHITVIKVTDYTSGCSD